MEDVVSDLPQRHRDADTGIGIFKDGAGAIHVRPNNQLIRNVPVKDRLLEIHCTRAGSRQGHLVAVVTTDMQVHVTNTPRASVDEWTIFTPCRCEEHGHKLDVRKVWAAADRLGHRPYKARREDVRRVAP